MLLLKSLFSCSRASSLAFIAPALFLVTGASVASESKWFAQAGLGVSMHSGLAQDRTLTDTFGFNDRFHYWENDNHAPAWNLGGGYNFPWEGYQFRLGIGYHQVGDFDFDGARADMGDIGAIGLNYRYKTTSKMLLLEAGLKIPVVESGNAYALFTAGLGYSWNTFKDFSSSPVEGSLSSLRIGDHEESHFAYGLGAAIGIPLSDRLFLEAGYRYLEAGKMKSGSSPYYSSPLVDDDLSLHFFEARLTLHF